MEVINTYDIQQRHQYTARGHWFDADNKRFFKSRWSNRAYLFKPLNVAFFVSSEKHEYSGSFTINEPRKYTIRAVCMETGEFLHTETWTPEHIKINEMEFQRYHTSREATNTIKKTNWFFIKPIVEELRK